MSILSALIAPVSNLVSEFIEDPDKSKELETRIKLVMLENEQEVKTKAADIVLAEANSDHWITSAWRPILMMTITAIVGLHYLLFPILNQFGLDLSLELPEELWTLLTVGVGGYTVGRSVEKAVDRYKK